MDVIIMLSITSLVDRLRADFPQFHFAAGEEFRWSPPETTVYFKEHSTDTSSLLHELSHALLGHNHYIRDIQLIEFEQAAWNYAKTDLSRRYGIEIDIEQVEDSLDTYRDWLHARSICPACGATGLQIKSHIYSCLACSTKWQVNDARVCGLRRTVRK
jgi:hypothetical protein